MDVEDLDQAALEISLINDLREIAGVAAKIDEFCTAQDLGHQVAYALNLAIDEILTHTISNGYDDDETHRIEIIVRKEADAIVVVIVDNSKVFDVSDAPEFEIGANLDDQALDRLGLFLVHQMMDQVEYRRLEGCNIVTLTKKTTVDG